MGARLMHPDKWSVTPFYVGFVLMGTPRTKTFAEAWDGREGAVAVAICRNPLPTCDDYGT
ncbi:hypothetical protein GCM10010176_021660 [Nonomuraea spiralis]|nr:hypothetical protein GCM10010176_021660 [Nonomuraea spiralis]